MAKTDIKSMQLDRLKEYVVSLGAKPFAAKQIYGWLHEKNVNSFDEMTNISKDLREKLKENCNKKETGFKGRHNQVPLST